MFYHFYNHWLKVVGVRCNEEEHSRKEVPLTVFHMLMREVVLKAKNSMPLSSNEYGILQKKSEWRLKNLCYPKLQVLSDKTWSFG